MSSRQSKKTSSLGLAVLAALTLLVAASCAPDDPSLPFLQSQPENHLAYPGASLVSTTTNGPGFPVNGCCSTEWKFSSSATDRKIGEWYDAELGKRDWVSDLDAHQNGDGSLSYSWHKPALELYLDFALATGGVTSYEVSLQSPSGEYKFVAPLEALRTAQEAGLAPLGATLAGSQGLLISRATVGGGSRAGIVGVTQDYLLGSPMSDALAFYDSTLRGRGWEPISILPSDNAHVVAKWAKWPIVALLETDTNTFTFGLWETLGADGSPVPLASGLVPNPGAANPDYLASWQPTTLPTAGATTR
jgi:hypothetical protein